jgi:hypothetical protein
VQEDLGIFVFESNGVIILEFWNKYKHMAGSRSTKCRLPILFINISFPAKLSWNWGLMKLSPVPDWVRMAK